MATLLERLTAIAPNGAGPWYCTGVVVPLSDVAEIVGALSTVDKLTKERDAFHADLQLARKGCIDEQTRADGLLKDVCALEIERDDLKAKVAEMTKGEPVAWKTIGQYGYCYRDTEEEARRTYAGAKVYPLFAAPPAPAQVGELQAKYEAEKLAHGETMKCLANRNADWSVAKARITDLEAANAALQARIDALTAGERLTKDALAAAEKEIGSLRENLSNVRRDRDNAQGERDQARDSVLRSDDDVKFANDRAAKWERDAKQTRESNLLTVGLLHAEKARAEAAEKRADFLAESERRSNNALAAAEAALLAAEAERDGFQASLMTVGREKRDALARAEAAEARVKVLEGSGEPAAWMTDVQTDVDQPKRTTPSKDIATCWAKDGATVEPLYRHPPKPAGDPVAWLSRTPGVSKWLSFDKSALASIPLYEAPPPVALGVEGERFAVLEHGRIRTVNVAGPEHYVGTRVQAERRAAELVAAKGTGIEAVQLVPADAPTVDVAAIRRALDYTKALWTSAMVDKQLDAIRAAIGEKA